MCVFEVYGLVYSMRFVLRRCLVGVLELDIVRTFVSTL